MTAWLRELKPSDDDRGSAVPHCSGELLTRTAATVGSEPVAWAVQIGDRAAERIFEAIPYFGSSAELRTLLYAACESFTLTALGTLAGPDHEAPPVTDDAKTAISYYAEHDVPLDQIQRGIRFAHAEIASAFLAACDALNVGDERVALLRVVSAQLFEHSDRYSREGADHYKLAYEAWAASPDAVLRRLVEGVIAGRDLGAHEIAHLHYNLDQTHLAVVVVGSNGAAVGAQQVAYDLLRRAGAANQLTVRVSDTTAWAWGGFRQSPSLATVRSYVQPGCRIALGAPAAGVDGFRRSHLQSRRVQDLLETAPRSASTLVFDEVEMALLLAQDLPAARRFVARLLGPLAQANRRNLEILMTVKAYLDLRGSPSAVADRMNLARNTVAARIQRASRELNRDIGTDCADLHGALVLVELLGERVLIDGT